MGLGYVGLPVAVAFGKHTLTVGFDINAKRIERLKAGFDDTGEVAGPELKAAKLELSSDPNVLRQADFHIVAVPTPVDEAHRPDLTPVVKASESVGSQLKKGDIVVYESTVYPGVTEDVCVPILERCSKLKCGTDFFVGYSPERINPGDKEHTFTKIRKVVSGMDAQTLEIVAATYGSVVEAGVFPARSIRVAEAAKVIENTQRDLNIALMNELAVLFDRMGIDTTSVLEAAGTKWNFLPFRPGLVGGHCIGVDPYYLTHKAEELGYHPQVILAGRRINDEMGRFVAQKTIKAMIQAGQSVQGRRVTVLGLTFKENCPDTRNTKVIDIIRELQEYGVEVQVTDPMADPAEAHHEYGLKLTPFEDLRHADAVVLAVAHGTFLKLTTPELLKLAGEKPVIIDVKSALKGDELRAAGASYWRL